MAEDINAIIAYHVRAFAIRLDGIFTRVMAERDAEIANYTKSAQDTFHFLLAIVAYAPFS